MGNDVNAIIIVWMPNIVLFLGAIGTIITVKAQAKKTNAETDMIKEQQQQLHLGQQKIQAQFVNNGGSTMKDGVDAIRGEIAGMRKDIGRLGEVDILDRATAAKENERLYAIFSDMQKDLSKHIEAVPTILQQHQQDTIKMIEGKLPCV